MIKEVIKKLFAGFLISLAFFTGIFESNAHASQVDMLIEKLVEKKILTRLDAESIRNEIETAEKKDFKAQIKSSNPWLEGLTSKGDVRLRYEAFNREPNESSFHDRNRFRFRVRWGLEKKFNDEWKAGFGLASGENRLNPTSTNQTLDEEFSYKSINIEKAYAIYTPQEIKKWAPVFNHVEIGGGKVENPYVRDKWNTSIIWDGDVTPEGLYEKVDFRIATPGDEAFWNVNTLAGQFVVDEDSDSSPGDINMFSYGIGTTYQWKKSHDIAFKYTYYDWEEYAQFIKTGGVNPDNPAGNDRNLDGFNIHNFYVETNFDIQTGIFGTQALKLFGDYAFNAGVSDANEAISTTDETLRNPAFRGNSDQAFSVGATLGKAKDPASWAFTYEYLYIEPNAVVGNFSESDLGLGFANNKGHKLNWKYMLLKDLELSFTAWLVERVDKTIITYGASGLRPNGDDDELLRTQLDLSYKF